MHDDTDDPAGIAEWLKKTGYPLEMRVGSVFRRYENLFCEHGTHFIDPITGIVRTTDICVHHGMNPSAVDKGQEFDLLVTFYIECKARPAPWVVFVDKFNDAVDDPSHVDLEIAIMHYPSTIGERKNELIEFINRDGSFYDYAPLVDPCKPTGYEICEKGTKEKDKPDPAYAAARQAASAAVALTTNSAVDDDSPRRIGIPVLVTNGLLHEAWMDEDDVLKVAQVDRSKMLVRIGGEYDSTLVHVVTEGGIENFARDCDDTAAALVGYSGGAGLA